MGPNGSGRGGPTEGSVTGSSCGVGRQNQGVKGNDVGFD